MYRFNTISIKFSVALFRETEKLILISIRSHKRPQIVKSKLRKNNIQSITVPDIKEYWKSTVNQTL
jgi:hypothetical protein